MSATAPPPFPAGTVYGVLLNHRDEWDAWAPRMDAAPYKGAPRAPVLYIKPANTWSANGADIPVPAGCEFEVGATVGLVMAGPNGAGHWVMAIDFALPHESYFRPAVKFRCLDGSLGLGSTRLAAGEVDVSAFQLEVRVNGTAGQVVDFRHLVRPAATLLADVAEFMTLREGDMLLLGLAANRPRARAGDRIEVHGGRLGILAHTLVQEAA